MQSTKPMGTLIGYSKVAEVYSLYIIYLMLPHLFVYTLSRVCSLVFVVAAVVVVNVVVVATAVAAVSAMVIFIMPR